MLLTKLNKAQNEVEMLRKIMKHVYNAKKWTFFKEKFVIN